MTKREAMMAIAEAFEERAAIAQFDGGLSRYEAEKLAARAAAKVRAELRLDLLKGDDRGNA